MAEAIMHSKGRPNFTAYRAGSHPTGHVNPHALKMIQTARLPIEGLRSKVWDAFAKTGRSGTALRFHGVRYCCQRGMSGLAWPTHDGALGGTGRGHWVGGAIERAFRDAFNVLDRRISFLLCLPFATLDKLAIQKEIDRIGNEISEVKANA